MLRRRNKKDTNAQIFVEYTVVIGAVVMILLTMNIMMKRGIQGMIKSVADQIGNQENADQSFDDSGHLEKQYTSTRADTSKTLQEYIGVDALGSPRKDTRYVYDDVIDTKSNMTVNLGYSPAD